MSWTDIAIAVFWTIVLPAATWALGKRYARRLPQTEDERMREHLAQNYPNAGIDTGGVVSGIDYAKGKDETVELHVKGGKPFSIIRRGR